MTFQRTEICLIDGTFIQYSSEFNSDILRGHNLGIIGRDINDNVGWRLARTCFYCICYLFIIIDEPQINWI